MKTVSSSKKKQEQCFETLDNRSFVYRVCFAPDGRFSVTEIYSNKVVIPPRMYKGCYIPTGEEMVRKFKKGYPIHYNQGSSILICLKQNKYMFIGHEIFEFQTQKSDESIVFFSSPVGNNMVPYPFAVSSTNQIYLMLEKLYIKTEYYDDAVRIDPHDHSTFYYKLSKGKKTKQKVPDMYHFYYENLEYGKLKEPFEHATASFSYRIVHRYDKKKMYSSYES